MKKLLKSFMILSIFGVVGFGSKVSAHELDTVYDDGTIEEYVVSESLELNSILESQFVEGELIQDESFSPVFPDDLEYISDGNTARTIIGSDNRRIVTNTSTYPFSTAAHLVMTFPNGKSYIGSGHLISNDTVLTAGHCIYSKADGGWATSVAVYPGYNGKTAPFGVAYASKLMSISGWTSNNSSEHDIGAIKLNKSIGKNTGYMGLTTNTNSGITLTGFHGDLNGKMGTESGSISSLTPNNVFYKLDSTGGASGSGVYNNNNQILAVHAYGRTSDNFGTRMNNEKYSIVYNWAFGKPVPTDNRHSVVTYWYPSRENAGYKKVMKYVNDRNWEHKVVTDSKGRLKIIVGKFQQNNPAKFQFEEFLGENNFAYNVYSDEDRYDRAETTVRQEVSTFWYPSKNNSGYKKVMQYITEMKWNSKVVTGTDGRVKIIVGTFPLKHKGKVDFEKFLAANKFNYTVTLSDNY